MQKLYLCDRTACNGSCPNIDCNHTSDPEHALHENHIFKKKIDESGNEIYWEILEDCHVKCDYINNAR